MALGLASDKASVILMVYLYGEPFFQHVLYDEKIANLFIEFPGNN